MYAQVNNAKANKSSAISISEAQEKNVKQMIEIVNNRQEQIPRTAKIDIIQKIDN
jgi:hypothetical protein